MSEPHTTRQKTTKADMARLYRPRVFNRISRTRFERNRLGEIAHHIGRPLSFTERVIASRVVSVEWWLLKIDARLDRGEGLSGHDIRGRLAAENRLRLDLVALGLAAPKPQQQPSLSDVLRKYGSKSGAEA